MGSALTLDLLPAPQAQLGFPESQDLSLFVPPQERNVTELVVAPEVALTRIPKLGAVTQVD
jgi:hypothetical protein